MALLKLAFLVMGIALVSGAVIDSKQTKEFENFLRESVKGTYQEPLTPELEKLQNYEERSGKFQGDIVLTEEQIDSMVKNYSGARNSIRDTRFHWPDKTVYYTISNRFNAEQVSDIEAAIEEIQQNTCLNFVKRTTQPDSINVVADTAGCYSFIGRIRGPQILNLQIPGCFRHGTIVHEFLHALGFFHQHSTHNRDDVVRIVWDKIQPGTPLNNFEKLTSTQVNNFGVEYDYSSILHYSEYAFSVDGSKTIEPLQSTTEIIGQRVGLSIGDISKLNQMYKC